MQKRDHASFYGITLYFLRMSGAQERRETLMENHFDFEEAIKKSEESRCQLAVKILSHKSRGERRANNAAKYRRRSKIITQDKRYNPIREYFPYRMEHGAWVEDTTHIRYPQNSRHQRWLKRATSKKTRIAKDIPRKGNHYRRIHEYWWDLF